MIRIGPYEISREIGAGALAIVHEAFDPKLKRKVALKVLHPIFSKNKQNIERLRHEALTLAQLHHPNIINIYDFLDAQDAIGIVTEYVEGQTLAQFLEQAPIILPEIACSIIAEMLSALEHAHSKKIVHRDIKPQNIIISSEGQLKLADFSIAKIMDQETLTLTGQLIGSPFYMSPEQAMGDSIDERSDIFTVGILFYKLVTGKLPFFDDDQRVVLKKILDVQFHMPSELNAKISPQLEGIILKALHKDKTQRFQKAWEFRYELLKYLKDQMLSFEDIELIDFFKDPKEYEIRFIQKYSRILLNQGIKALSEKNYEKSSQLWNLALEYDPVNEYVREELKKLTVQRGKRKVAVLVAVLFLLAIGGGVYRNLGGKHKPEEINSVAEKTEMAPPRDHSVLNAGAVSSPPVGMPSKPDPNWAYLEMNMDDDTDCFVDGKRKILDETKTVRLKPGLHQIRFKKDGFKDIQAVIQLKKGETSVVNVKKENP